MVTVSDLKTAEGSMLTQSSKQTVLLRPNCKEVISRGDDY